MPAGEFPNERSLTRQIMGSLLLFVARKIHKYIDLKNLQIETPDSEPSPFFSGIVGL